MEYSVFDLVRALLKKWYVIVLVMALVSGASVFTSRASYEKPIPQRRSPQERPARSPSLSGMITRLRIFQNMWRPPSGKTILFSSFQRKPENPLSQKRVLFLSFMVIRPMPRSSLSSRSCLRMLCCFQMSKRTFQPMNFWNLPI